jgi:hypothetical protein
MQAIAYSDFAGPHRAALTVIAPQETLNECSQP